jgi:predicted DNA-binding transcriptional regulator AlpA
MRAEPQDAKVNAPGLTRASTIEPLLRVVDLERVLNCDRRTIERMRSSARLPKPDLYVGRRSPRWRADTIRAWIASGGKGA